LEVATIFGGTSQHPQVAALRARADEIREAELRRAESRLGPLSDAQRQASPGTSLDGPPVAGLVGRSGKRTLA